MRGKYLVNNLKKKDRAEGITLVVTFSRNIFVPIFFRNLEDLKMPRKDMHLLIYDNSTDPVLGQNLTEKAYSLMHEFKSVRLYKSYLRGRGNIAGSGNEVFSQSKLWNIWHMWKRLFVKNGGMIYTDTFFQLEDDTISMPKSFPKLYKKLLSDEKIAMVTAIETGRSSAPWVPVSLGVHYMKMKGLFVLERHSLNPNTKGIVEVDGCGVYCFVARTKLFQLGFKDYDPVKLNVPFFALDNILVWNIKRKGYKIFADFSLWCTHLQASSGRIIAFSRDQAVEMYTAWFPKCNNYAQGVFVKGKEHKPSRYQVRRHADTWEI